MKSRVFSIPFSVFVLVMWVYYPLFAQVGGPGVSGGPQAVTSPQIPSLPQSTSSVPSESPIQIPFNKSETNIQPLTGQKQSLQEQAQQQDKKTDDNTVKRLSGEDYAQGVQPISPIESFFRGVLEMRAPAGSGISVQGIRQFGYNIFSHSSISTFAPVENIPVSPDYVLGPGDELRIIVWGAMENTYAQTVDRYGRIYLPTVGPIRVWGLTFTQAEKLILAYLSQYYKGFQSSVTMGNLRTIKVYVVGEVKQPGSYNISALSTLTNALVAAGGPTNMGTLRKIELKRNNQTIEYLDLYDFLLFGDKSRDCRLEAGDVIFVPPIGKVAGILGEIKRPAIYEFKETIRIRDIIDLGGGFTVQSYLNRVQITRSKQNQEREVLDIDLNKAASKDGTSNNIEIQDGDVVIVFSSDPRVYNVFSIEGKVKHPGDYEYKRGIRISQALSQQEILPEAYLDNVEILRFREDLTTQIVNVNLKKAWSGDVIQDIELMPRDTISVRSEFKAPEMVTLSGEFKLPGVYTIQPGERISSVVKRAGGFTNKAYFEGAVFIRRSVAQREQDRLNFMMRDLEESILSEEKTIFESPEKSKFLQEQEAARRREQLRVLASNVVLGRIVIDLNTIGKFEGTEGDLVLQDGDRLTVPTTPAEVLVVGSVRNPAAIIYRKNVNAQYYIDRSGGFLKGADKKEMYLLKANGSAMAGFLKLKEVAPGDAIIVPAKFKIRDLSWISQVATISGQTMLSLAALSSIANNK